MVGLALYSLWRVWRFLFRLAENADRLRVGKSGGRSEAVRRGKHVEQIVPVFNPNFRGRKDVRFLGGPVDYVIFDEDGKVTFVEVKTGRSTLTPKQLRIKEAVERGHVRWETLRVP